MVSGHVEALGEVERRAMGAGALKAQMLAVAGAFHTPLMQPAAQDLAKVCVRVCAC